MLARNILFFISVLVAFIGGTQLPELTHKVPITQHVSEAPSCQSAGTESDIKQIDLAASNQKSITKKHHHDDNQDVVQKEDSSGVTHDPDLTTPIIEGIQNSQEFTGWLNDNIEKNPGFDIGSAMQGEFDQEVRDSNWAEQEEVKVSDLFFESEHLEGLALSDIECRETQCRLSIAVTNLDQANSAVDDLLNSFVSQQDFRQIVAAPNPDENLTTLYVSRDAGGLSFNR